ncbi:hypothetical protein EVAR_61844_1 [Eumeta japonica]|uniref:Uncharacterized protein n=1 Tax=Eumeta variegata TaxID=151549 RepID=A0A4C1YXS6_EUMVA|nr:hypothetical protein EVAR_61844_1 [Eumeta japonica]
MRALKPAHPVIQGSHTTGASTAVSFKQLRHGYTLPWAVKDWTRGLRSLDIIQRRRRPRLHPIFQVNERKLAYMRDENGFKMFGVVYVMEESFLRIRKLDPKFESRSGLRPSGAASR